MKKFLSLLLAMSMLLALSACGGGSDTPAAKESQPPAAQESAAQEPAAETPGAEESAPAEAPTDAAELGDPVVLTVINGFPEADFASQCFAYFCDLVEEKSGGNITFDRYFGGTFCTPLEEFGYVSSGAVDMATLLPITALENLVLWNVPGPAGSEEQAIACAKYILFENEKTAPLAEAEATASNVKILGVQHASTTAYVTKTQVSSFQDMVDAGCIYGTEVGAASFEAMGLDCQTISLHDMYESLSRGVINSTGAGLSAVYANKWYEVAPYVMTTNNSNATNFFTINLDRWNSLTEAQQQLIQECVDETTQYGLDWDAELRSELIASMEGEGATITPMESESESKYVEIQYATAYEAYAGVAAAQGLSDEYETVVKETLDYMGYDLDTILANLHS